MKFLDQAKIYTRSGHGGPGAVSFRREAHVPFGGPDGGDGGRGGDVIARAVAGLNTLIDYRYQQHFKAQAGKPGDGRDRSGGAGQPVFLKLPVGTQILADDQETVLADLTEEGQEFILAKGGAGGKGNAFFKSSTNRAPRKSQPGETGQEMWVWLRLKLIADAGLLGLPNAGKSTFLARVTRAKPKIADYPFTTLHPNLSVAAARGHEFVIADIPGLIAGASEGAGLGHRFLGHVERCAFILHLVDATQDDVVEAYSTIRRELAAYDANLAQKQELIVLSKADSVSEDDLRRKQADLEQAAEQPVRLMSAVSGVGIDSLLDRILSRLDVKTAISEQEATEWHP